MTATAAAGQPIGQPRRYGPNSGFLREGDVIQLHDKSFHLIQYVNTSGAYAVPLASAARQIGEKTINFTAGGRTISAMSLVDIVNPLAMGGNSPEYRRYVKMASASGKQGIVDEAGVPFDMFDTTPLVAGDSANLDETDSIPTTKGTDIMAKKASKAKTKSNGAAKAKATKTVRSCVCGCGTETTGYFAPGHDARYHGWIKKLADGRIQRNGKEVKSGEQVIGAALLNKMGLVAKGEGFKANTPEFYAE